MNKPRLKFEIYRWPLSIIPDDLSQNTKTRRCAAIFGEGAGIRVGTYYKAGLDGMQKAIATKRIEYESEEYKEYNKLNDIFLDQFSKETDFHWDKEFEDN